MHVDGNELPQAFDAAKDNLRLKDGQVHDLEQAVPQAHIPEFTPDRCVGRGRGGC